MIKCIGKLCPKYTEELIGGMECNYCNLVNDFVNSYTQDCIGFDHLPNKREELACKIAKLTTEYNSLTGFEEYIKDYQGDIHNGKSI